MATPHLDNFISSNLLIYSMKIKEMNEDSRPRERLLKFGIENLSTAEILAIMLRTGSQGENVIEMSNRLINVI